MRRKIQRSMILVITTTLLITYAITTFVVYRQTISLMEDEIRQEADYICAAVGISGEAYLKEMDAVRKNTRVTMIDDQGRVTYDSKEDEVTLENHKSRPEVKEALSSGSGQDIRKSDTLGQEMFYYAQRLPDGNVLRVSKTVDTAFFTAIRILPAMGVIAVVMLLIAWILARWQVARLIRPINELDLDNPMENDVYEELTPLLMSIDRQNKEKDAIANMRKEFSANVSHELKTPLTSISGYAEIMKDGLVKPEDMKKFSERIYNEASRLITLVEDIIKLSRLDEGKVELEKEEVDLYQLAREVCSRLAPQANARDIRIEVTGEAVTYKGIRQILDEMVYNICENAIKYNDNETGGYVHVSLNADHQYFYLKVEDNGIGIPEESLEHIYERFYRVDKSHSREIGGTGLGLAITRSSILMHRGAIKAHSVMGEGTTFDVRIPLNYIV